MHVSEETPSEPDRPTKWTNQNTAHLATGFALSNERLPNRQLTQLKSTSRRIKIAHKSKTPTHQKTQPKKHQYRNTAHLVAGLALSNERLPPPDESSLGLGDVEDVTHVSVVDLLELLFRGRCAPQKSTKNNVKLTPFGEYCSVQKPKSDSNFKCFVPTTGVLYFTLLEPQSRFGDTPLKLQVICAQNGTAVLKGRKASRG